MDDALGPAYSRSWASMFVIAPLGVRTVSEALGAGMAP
jgi:predicted secreted protein